MRSIRQFAGFVGYPFPSVSMVSLRQHLSPPDDQVSELPSLRSLISGFEAFPAPFDFSLDVTPTSGTAPLQTSTGYGPFVGQRIRGVLSNPPDFTFRVLKGGQVIRNAPSLSGFDHRFTEGGSYVIEAAAQGVGSTGYSRVVRTATVAVRNVPTPPPPPVPIPLPPLPPVISVDYRGPAGQASFTVTGSKFVPSHVVHIRVVNTANLVNVFFDSTSDSSGQLSHEINFACAPGTTLSFSANDERDDRSDLTGTLWSNTATVTAS
ncbi:hypothetical protein ACVBEQ_07630 [Nakamurella sp. GG22]